MTAADEQCDGVLQRLATLLRQCLDRDVPAQVVDRVERHLPGGGVGLGRGGTNHERAGQPRSNGHRDGIRALANAGLLLQAAHRCPHGGLHGLQVGAAGDLRDHATEAGMLLHGTGDLVDELLDDRGAVCFLLVTGRRAHAHHTDAGLVAGAFDTHDQHGLCGLRASLRTVLGLAGALLVGAEHGERVGPGGLVVPLTPSGDLEAIAFVEPHGRGVTVADLQVHRPADDLEGLEELIHQQPRVTLALLLRGQRHGMDFPLRVRGRAVERDACIALQLTGHPQGDVVVTGVSQLGAEGVQGPGGFFAEQLLLDPRHRLQVGQGCAIQSQQLHCGLGVRGFDIRRFSIRGFGVCRFRVRRLGDSTRCVGLRLFQRGLRRPLLSLQPIESRNVLSGRGEVHRGGALLALRLRSIRPAQVLRHQRATQPLREVSLPLEPPQLIRARQRQPFGRGIRVLRDDAPSLGRSLLLPLKLLDRARHLGGQRHRDGFGSVLGQHVRGLAHGWPSYQPTVLGGGGGVPLAPPGVGKNEAFLVTSRNAGGGG